MPYLTKDLREKAVSEILKLVRSIRDKDSKAEILVELVPYLSKSKDQTEIISEILKLVKNVNDYKKAEIIVNLAPYLPKNLLKQTFQVAKGIKNKAWKSMALIGLEPYCSGDLVKSLELLYNIKHEFLRVKALISIVPHLTEDLLEEVLEWAWSISKESLKIWALKVLIPYLPQDLIKDVFKKVCNIGTEYFAEVLMSLAPHLPEEALKEALEIARGIEEEKYRAKALVALAPHLVKLAPQELYPLWREMLPVLAARPRKELLENLKALVPVILALGGREAVAETFRAIKDVGRWWP